MRDRLDAIEKRYNQINEMFSDPDIVKDIKKMT